MIGECEWIIAYDGAANPAMERWPRVAYESNGS
jgi:hypothetical protein